jgi:hypothetical protein
MRAPRIEADKKYRANHLEAVRKHDRERKRKWHAEHVAEHRRLVRLWRYNNPELARAKDWRNRVRRKRCKHKNGGSFTASQWTELKQRYQNRCLCCHRSETALLQLGLKLVPDHVLALVKGGTNDISNIQPLCHGTEGCNNKKGTLHIDYRGAVEQRTSESTKAT